MNEANTPDQTGSRVCKVLGRLRDRHPDMTVLQAQCFFTVAARPGISQRQLMNEMDSNDSTISRILALLSDLGDRKSAGLDLIEMKVNPMDRRERLMFLSPKGKRFIADVASDLATVDATEKASAGS
jgi:DNA-binding MarR family transcriptional regulator